MLLRLEAGIAIRCQRSARCQVTWMLSCCTGPSQWELQDQPLQTRQRPAEWFLGAMLEILPLGTAVKLFGSVCCVKRTWKFLLSPRLCFNLKYWHLGKTWYVLWQSPKGLFPLLRRNWVANQGVWLPKDQTLHVLSTLD